MGEASAESWHAASDTLEDPEERRVLFAALDSFRQYRRAAHLNITHRRRQSFYALPEPQWKMLAAPPFNVLSHFDRVDDAIDANADIALDILQTGLAAFAVSPEPQEGESDWRDAATPADLEKAKSTLRQFYRDWSAEGAKEREACHRPVLSGLERLFQPDQRGTTRVLVPGAGLGRLLFEVCKLGFCAEGNEISFHQLMSSNWVLNHVAGAAQHSLYPFALNFSNNLNRENQLRSVRIPDIHPGTELDLASKSQAIHAFERMSMTAADFIVLYSDEKHRDMFDVVATVFFIDTAPNVIRYIETIRSTLKTGGYWLNVGPLLWHFADVGPKPAGGEDSTGREELGIGERGNVELTYEEVLMLVERMGFAVEKQEILEPGAGYSQDPESMLQTTYRCSHFVARKTC